MHQAVLEAPGRISIKDVPIPEPKGGEVLIRVEAALTCGTDLKAYLRGHSLIPMPGPFGHEYAGVVVQVGPSVKGFKEGDPVMGVHSAPCRQCYYCQKGLFNLCENIMDTKVLGAYGEYLLLPAPVVRENLYKKPDSLPFEYAALLEPLACVVHPYSRIDLALADRALIIGAGPIGLLHLIYLMSQGVEVSVLDVNSERLQVAEKIGATKTHTPEALRTWLKQPDFVGFDLVIECTGNVQVWMEAVEYVRRGGTVVLFGGCPQGTEVKYSTYRLHYDELTLMGSFHFSPADVAKAREFLIEYHSRFSPLLSGRFGLKDISEVFERLKQGQGIKYVIQPQYEGGSSV